MNAPTIAIIGFAGALLAGCETMGGPQTVAEAQRPDCKAVVVTNTPERLRMQNRRGVDGDEMRRAEGTLAMGKLKLNEPRILQNPVAPEESITSKVLREC